MNDLMIFDGDNEVQHQRDLTLKQATLVFVSMCVVTTILSRVIYAPCDDAYIFYVYVRNFLAGDGLTYNGTVVWGFTSVLWTGALSMVALLGIPVHVGGELLSTVSGWLALWATYFLGRSVGLSRLYAFVPVLLLAATGDFIFYSSVGLEQVFFTGLVATAAALVFSKHYMQKGGVVSTAGIMAAMVLTRPEGALLSALLLLAILAELRSIRTPLRGVVA